MARAGIALHHPPKFESPAYSQRILPLRLSAVDIPPVHTGTLARATISWIGSLGRLWVMVRNAILRFAYEIFRPNLKLTT